MTVFTPIDPHPATPSFMPPDSPSAESLEDQLSTLFAQITVATCQWLELLAQFDVQKLAAKNGFLSTAHWLNYRCGIALGAAREKVRVARALTELPLINNAFSSARISYSKVRALTRAATPANEKKLLHIALHATASQTERILRDYRRCTRSSQHTRYQEEESLRYYFDEYGDLVFKGRLPGDQGELLLKALEQVMDQAPTTEETDRLTNESDRIAAKRARALTELAELAMTSFDAPGTGGGLPGRYNISSAERYQIHVHVKVASAHAIPEDSVAPIPALEDGPALPPETLERLSCDASLIRYATDSQGYPLDVGRKTRTISPAVRRALKVRDGGCRFPGCTHRRFVDAHHIQHWSKGGATKLNNLVLLCRYHHRLIHEYGYQVTSAQGQIRFSRPNGAEIPEYMDDLSYVSQHRADVPAGTPCPVIGSHVHARSLTPKLDQRPPDYQHIAWYLVNFAPRE